MTADLPIPANGVPHPTIDWGRCLVEHADWLRQVIRARTGEPQAVDEVWQQVALAAVAQRSPLADPAKVAPWLHRLAVVLSARYRRKQGRGRKALATIAAQAAGGSAAASDPIDLLLRRERHELTRQAVAQLAPRDAEILLLKYGQRWSYRQIAERLGITEKAVDARMQRAREKLRFELSRLGIEGDD
ncbi:MAG TPA: RNA polymerase sigma factor [Pirellulaceae bacterium]|nr:RNA polymerase sigma factor [Pirellulaceae bacterium]